MAKKLFVGGLPYEMGEDRLRELFSEFGPIQYLKIIQDQETGKSRGFGFVEYESEAEAEAAREGLGGKRIDGRFMTVREAIDRKVPHKPRSERWKSPEPEFRSSSGPSRPAKKVRTNRRRRAQADEFGDDGYG